jgi:hypothetical protein
MKNTHEILRDVYDFCAVRETSSWQTLSVRNTLPNRFNYLIDYIKSLGIEYVVDEYRYPTFMGLGVFRNIILPGKTSNKYFMGHYDVANIHCDNANDNSASVYNLIALKMQNPDINVVLTDAEEPPFLGYGSERLGLNLEKSNAAAYVLNLDVTGWGKDLLISNYCNKDLNKRMKAEIGAIEYGVPWNDCYSLLNANKNVDCEIVVLAEKTADGKMNTDHFRNIHSYKDTIATLDLGHMENLVNKLDAFCKN